MDARAPAWHQNGMNRPEETKMNKKTILPTSLLIVAALISSIAAPRLLSTVAATKPLADRVIIRRDTYGVPHILAETEEAAAFGMGYAQAEDHAVEVARRFLSARGEEAKYTGLGVESDFESKRYGLHEVARKNFGRLSPVMQGMMSAFAAGFNRYVEKNRQQLPAWIPAFDATDVLARCRQEIFRFTFDRNNLISRIKQKYPTQARTARLEPRFQSTSDEGLDGSNMWSIAGSRTTSGKPILMGNPHQAWSVLYWEAHITVPGKINLFGTTYAGLPVLRHGFNDTLGWTHTVNNIDPEDVYSLRLDPQNAAHYLFDGKSLPLTKLALAVEVKQSDGTARTEHREYWASHLGPVIHQTTDRAFAIKSSILDEVRFFDQWYAMGKAKNWREFYDTLKMNVLPMFNLSYADVEGNTFYLWSGMLPKRLDDGMDYRLDVPGETSKYVWTGLHPMEELPQLLNPKGGYLQNCNSAPWWTSLRDPLDPTKYPSYLEPGGQLSLRSQMSLEILEGQPKFSLQDVMRLKFSPKMLLADRVKPDLMKAIRQMQNPSDELKRGLAVIEAWDNTTAADSRGGVLFKRFLDGYVQTAKQPFAVAWDEKNPARTPHGLANPAEAVRYFEEAVRWTRRTFGSENVAWGEVHRLRLGDLDLPASGGDGAHGSFHVQEFGQAPDGKRVMGTIERGKPMGGRGDGWTFAIEFSKPVVGYSLTAYGQTTIPGSKHSTDQLKLFATHQYKRAWLSEADIKANLEREYRP